MIYKFQWRHSALAFGNVPYPYPIITRIWNSQLHLVSFIDGRVHDVLCIIKINCSDWLHGIQSKYPECNVLNTTHSCNGTLPIVNRVFELRDIVPSYNNNIIYNHLWRRIKYSAWKDQIFIVSYIAYNVPFKYVLKFDQRIIRVTHVCHQVEMKMSQTGCNIYTGNNVIKYFLTELHPHCRVTELVEATQTGRTEFVHVSNFQ